MDIMGQNGQLVSRQLKISLSDRIPNAAPIPLIT